MRTLEEIREDLKNIRYYYARKEYYKNVISVNNIPIKDWKANINLYVNASKKAPRRLKDAFEGLYLGNNTQKQLASQWEVTEKYIQILNKRLIVYLQSILPDRVLKPIKTITVKEGKEFTIKWLG